MEVAWVLLGEDFWPIPGTLIMNDEETKRAENMKIILCSTYWGLALIPTFCEERPGHPPQHRKTSSSDHEVCMTIIQWLWIEDMARWWKSSPWVVCGACWVWFVNDESINSELWKVSTRNLFVHGERKRDFLVAGDFLESKNNWAQSASSSAKNSFRYNRNHHIFV